MRRLVLAALTALALALAWAHYDERTFLPQTTDVAEASDRERARIGFVDERRLDEHYHKHSSEFGRITKLDYLHQAQLLRDAPAGGPVLETVRGDGVTTKFDRQTGSFVAFNRDGTIRTFFKPNDGERYYRRQAERGATQ